MEIAVARDEGAFASPTTLKRPREADPSDDARAATVSIPRRSLEESASSLLNAPPSKNPQAAWSPSEVDKLEREFPSPWHAQPSLIQELSQERQLHMLCYMQHSAPVKASAWSSDGRFLATVTALGSVHIFDSRTFRGALVNVQVQSFRDSDETEIDEFYRVKFTPDNSKVMVAGARKSRRTFDAVDRENKVLPSSIKVFDCVTGKCLARFEGHIEEIHCLKIVPFRGKTYLLTGSEDGFLIKWKLNQDFTAYEKQSFFGDKSAQMVFCVSFLPDCGNKYFLAAVDDGLRLYDFEYRQLLQSFPGLYGSFCDYVKFVPLRMDEAYADQLAAMKPQKKRKSAPTPKRPAPPTHLAEDLKTEDLSASIGGTSSSITSSANTPNPTPASPKAIEQPKPKRTRRKKLNQREYLFITRGAELLDREDPTKMLKPNAVHLRRLSSPKCGVKEEAVPHEWHVELIHTFEHRQYSANQWPIKCAVTDRYVFCPTGDGKVFIWSLLKGDLVASLADHVRDIPIRHISVNPVHSWIATSSDDHYCVIYTDEQIERDEDGNIVDARPSKALDSNFDVSSLFADVPTNPPPSRFTPQLRAPPQRFSSLPQMSYPPRTTSYPPFPTGAAFYPVMPTMQVMAPRPHLPAPPSKAKEERRKAKLARLSKLQQQAAQVAASNAKPSDSGAPTSSAPVPSPSAPASELPTPKSPGTKPSASTTTPASSTPSSNPSSIKSSLASVPSSPNPQPTQSKPSDKPYPSSTSSAPPASNPNPSPPLPNPSQASSASQSAQGSSPHPMQMQMSLSAPMTSPVVGMPMGFPFSMMPGMPGMSAMPAAMPMQFAQQITAQLPPGTDPRMIEIINTLAATAAISQQQLAINAMSNPFNYYAQLQKMMHGYPQFMTQMPQMAQMQQMMQMPAMPPMAQMMPQWPMLAMDPATLAAFQQQMVASTAPRPGFSVTPSGLPGASPSNPPPPPNAPKDAAKK